MKHMTAHVGHGHLPTDLMYAEISLAQLVMVVVVHEPDVVPVLPLHLGSLAYHPLVSVTDVMQYAGCTHQAPIP